MPATPDITFVVPSHNRRAALRENLPHLLELEGLLEVIVVVDQRADDGTDDMIREEFGGDERVRLIRQAGNGLPSARNAGIAAARGEWIVVSDDDLRYPRDYGQTLKAVAAEQNADVVGAPWLHLHDGDLERAMAEARVRHAGIPRIDDHSVVPDRELRTPFMPAPALIHRRVFERVSFYEHYGNTGWRDETDFFIQVMRAGFTCILSPRTAMYQLAQWEGGSRRPRLEYEFSAIKNNWQFLRRHGNWLVDQGHIRTPSLAQLSFIGHRLRLVGKGWTQARWRGLRDRLPRVRRAEQAARTQ